MTCCRVCFCIHDKNLGSSRFLRLRNELRCSAFMENIIIWWIEKVIWNKNQLFPGHIDLHYLIFSHFTGSNVPGPHYLTQTSAGSPVLLSVLLLTSALLVSLFSLPMLWRQHMWYIHLYILNTCDTCVIICSIDRCNKQSTKEPQLYVVHTLHLIYKYVSISIKLNLCILSFSIYNFI